MKSALMYLGCALALGVTPLFEKLASRGAPSWIMIAVRSLFVGLLYFAGAWAFSAHKELAGVKPIHYLWIVISGIIGPTIGMFLYFELLRSQPTAKVVALTATYPVFTAILATFVLREPFTAVQFLGIVLTCAGVALVAR
ncbi:MAG: DMT family transporter [Nitrospirae bacterium]|nr:DMT family transporter [Nitrospirota bacterium]